MIILTSIFVVGVERMFSLVITLFSSVITLPVSYNSGGGCNGPPVALGIKPGVCDLGGCGPDAGNLSF